MKSQRHRNIFVRFKNFVKYPPKYANPKLRAISVKPLEPYAVQENPII